MGLIRPYYRGYSSFCGVFFAALEYFLRFSLFLFHFLLDAGASRWGCDVPSCFLDGPSHQGYWQPTSYISSWSITWSEAKVSSCFQFLRRSCKLLLLLLLLLLLSLFLQYSLSENLTKCFPLSLLPTDFYLTSSSVLLLSSTFLFSYCFVIVLLIITYRKDVCLGGNEKKTIEDREDGAASEFGFICFDLAVVVHGDISRINRCNPNSSYGSLLETYNISWSMITRAHQSMHHWYLGIVYLTLISTHHELLLCLCHMTLDLISDSKASCMYFTRFQLSHPT